MQTRITIGRETAAKTNKKTLTLGGLVFAVLVIAILLMETMLLKGEMIVSDTVNFATVPEPVIVNLGNLTENVFIHVRSGSKKRQVALKVKVLDKDGKVILQFNESMRHYGSRYFSFKPETIGQYRVYVKGEKGLFGTQDGIASVRIYINDKRFFWKLWRLKF